jgi:hypothetical protein
MTALASLIPEAQHKNMYYFLRPDIVEKMKLGSAIGVPDRVPALGAW